MQTNSDTWTDYNRKHNFVDDGEVKEDLGPGNDRWRRRYARCTRCHQTRSVFGPAFDWTGTWGCPKIPWRYRLRLRLTRRDVPTWDVNEAPPWV